MLFFRRGWRIAKKHKMKKINWQKIALKKHLKEIVSSGTTYAILVLVFLLWRFALGFEFHLQEIEPFQQPSIFVRSFYSLFTFWTLGRLLYFAGFYKLLHDIVVKAFGAWQLYYGIKGIIWAGLMYISYQYIVPWLFTVLNTGASILYNIAAFVLYVLPPLGITLIAAIIYLLWKTKKAALPPYEEKTETTKS